MDVLKEEVKSYDAQRQWQKLFHATLGDAYQIPRKTTEASRREHAPLNRYSDVLPYDHNRIKLQKLIKESDYINASLIKVDLVDQAYILTQGPLASTVAHFWSMVWQEKSKAIIMLNRVIECNEIKCHKYWPDANDSEFIFEGSNYNLKVKYVSEIASQFYTVRNLILIDNQTEEQRTVLHFHYQSWPDFGIPATAADFIEFLHAVRNSQALNNSLHGPAIVHCSAGIGRSGTFCLVDSALRYFEKTNKLDTKTINEILLNMRKGRFGCVQTPDQYRFSFLALLFENERMQSNGKKEKEETVEESQKSKKTIENQRTESESVEETTNQELRKRAREERKEKTLEQIKRIKKHSKEAEQKVEFRKILFKYSSVLIAASFLIGAGVFINRIS